MKISVTGVNCVIMDAKKLCYLTTVHKNTNETDGNATAIAKLLCNDYWRNKFTEEKVIFQWRNENIQDSTLTSRTAFVNFTHISWQWCSPRGQASASRHLKAKFLWPWPRPLNVWPWPWKVEALALRLWPWIHNWNKLCHSNKLTIIYI